jgi:hypothetical protein
MGWSKSTRIKVMLVIDLMFFLLELGVGFAVHSLALMADAFHMVSHLDARGDSRANSASAAQRHHLVACRLVGGLGREKGDYRQVFLWREYFFGIGRICKGTR